MIVSRELESMIVSRLAPCTVTTGAIFSSFLMVVTADFVNFVESCHYVEYKGGGRNGCGKFIQVQHLFSYCQGHAY